MIFGRELATIQIENGIVVVNYGSWVGPQRILQILQSLCKNETVPEVEKSEVCRCVITENMITHDVFVQLYLTKDVWYLDFVRDILVQL